VEHEVDLVLVVLADHGQRQVVVGVDEHLGLVHLMNQFRPEFMDKT
jgi:hypothetical protein